MLPNEELEKLIKERRDAKDAEYKRQRLYMEAFRMRICPKCGSNNVKYRIKLLSGGEELSCLDCGESKTYYSDY